MYLEGVKNGRRFLEAIRAACRQKPVAILKAGRTATSRSAASHTGSLWHPTSGFSAQPVGSAARLWRMKTRVSIRCGKGTHTAAVRPPDGNRIFSISTSGGAGTLAADQAEK